MVGAQQMLDKVILKNNKSDFHRIVSKIQPHIYKRSDVVRKEHKTFLCHDDSSVLEIFPSLQIISLDDMN